MNESIQEALSFYDINVKSIVSLNDDNDAVKLTDDLGNHYFLKTYGKANDYDVTPNVRLYHTYEQIQLESEILNQLSGSVLQTPIPLKNKHGDYVSTLGRDSDGEFMFATLTSFIDGLVTHHTQVPTREMAYAAGIAAARLHMESKTRLLPLAVKRPHKRQAYMGKVRDRLGQGIASGNLSGAQYALLCQCCDVIVDCMDRLDKDADNHVGLVHTDIISGNIVYGEDQGTLIDFSRSIYSYYLYDLAEMCLHANFGGYSPDLQRAIISGYHSEKPLTKDDMLAMQALFVMFLLTVMCESIDVGPNEWRDNVLKWFAGEVYPGLISGKGYLDASVYEHIV